MGQLELWQSLGVALAVGLLIGAERERDKPHGGSAGVRTFALFSVVGALAVLVGPVLGAVLVGGALVLVVAGYLGTRARDRGLTSEAAAVAMLGLGALSISRPAVSVALAVAITVLLVSRSSLHRFVQETVTDRERTDALKFFVAAFVVLPVLPTGRFGPYDVWVPQRIWLLVVLIIGIGFVGYTASRMLGAHRGLMVTGLAGGFVSATATTGVMGTRMRRGEAPMRSALAGAVLASVSTLVQLAVVTAVAEPAVTLRLLPAVATGSLVLAAEAWWLGRRADVAALGAAESTGHPFALAPAVLLAAIISAVLPLALWLQERYGTAGSMMATAAGGLADAHGASVAMATLVHTGQASLGTAVAAIGAALVTNTLSKLVVAAATGGPRFAALLLGCLAPAAAVVAATLLLT